MRLSLQWADRLLPAPAFVGQNEGQTVCRDRPLPTRLLHLKLPEAELRLVEVCLAQWTAHNLVIVFENRKALGLVVPEAEQKIQQVVQ